jgi:polyhydroxyalkanoate synthesis regulator phasin
VRTKWIIATTAAGAVVLGGLAVAGPALAEDRTRASAVERITEALSGLVDDGSITQEQADEVASTLAGSGLGGGHRGGHGPGFDLAAAAEALGLTDHELRTALEADATTLAEVAEDEGVEVETLVDALVTAAEKRIAEAVEDGRLTQDEADERLADLATRITERVNTPLPERPGGRRGGQGERD